MQTIARYLGTKPDKEWQLVLIMGALELVFSQVRPVLCVLCGFWGSRGMLQQRRRGAKSGQCPRPRGRVPGGQLTRALLPLPLPAPQLPSLEGARPPGAGCSWARARLLLPRACLRA